MDGMLMWQNLYDVLARIIKWSVVVAVISTALILILSVTDIIGSKFFNQGSPGFTPLEIPPVPWRLRPIAVSFAVAAWDLP